MSIPRFTHPHQQLKGKIAKKSLFLQIHVLFFMKRLKQSCWTKKTFRNFVQCSTAWPFLIPLQREGVSWKIGFHWRRETGGISCPAHACNSRGLELFPAGWFCVRYKMKTVRTSMGRLAEGQKYKKIIEQTAKCQRQHVTFSSQRVTRNCGVFRPFWALSSRVKCQRREDNEEKIKEIGGLVNDKGKGRTN